MFLSLNVGLFISESATDLEYFGERGHSWWNLEASDSQQEMGVGLLNESEGNLNGITDKGGLHASRYFNSNTFCPMPGQDSSDGLRLSYLNNNYPMNAFGGGSSRSFFTMEQPALQTNMEDSSVPGGSIKGTGSIPFPVAADIGFHFNDEKEDSEYHELETSFQTEYEESKQNENHIPSLSKLQNRETGNCALSNPLLFKWLKPFLLELTIMGV